MTLQQRNRLRLIMTVLLLALTAMTLLFRFRLGSLAEQLVITHVDNQASDAINLAIAEQLSDGEIEYDRIVDIQKDQSGNVTAVQINTQEVNRLKTSVLTRLDEKLSQLSLEQISIPAGSVIWPELFSGKGPSVPVRVLAARTSDADFRSSFSQAGINQTLHIITVDIQVVITVLTWGGTVEVPVQTSVVAAQTVIVGTVPAAYFQMEDSYGSETGDFAPDGDFEGSQP